MHTIDVPQDISDFAADILSHGVTTVIRYYNRSNSSALPSKRIGPAEARALADAGLKLAVVFQQRGGSNGNIQDLDRDNGRRDAARAGAGR